MSIFRTHTIDIFLIKHHSHSRSVTTNVDRRKLDQRGAVVSLYDLTSGCGADRSGGGQFIGLPHGRSSVSALREASERTSKERVRS